MALALAVAVAMAVPEATVAQTDDPAAERAGTEGDAEGTASPAGAAPAAAVFYETATVEARPLDSATAAVTVVDRATIEELGARTAADALRFVPGLDVTGNGARGGLTTAQIRGGDPNFTLVLLDGVPLNDGTYQVGDVFNLEGLPASAIERIEVVRGPFSSVYGSTGLAGVIHIVTRRGMGGEVGSGGGGGTAAERAGVWSASGVEVALEVGDAAERRATASVAGGRYWIGASWEEESGRVAAESFSQGSIVGRLGVALGDRADLRIAGRVAGWRSDDYPDASGGPVYGSGELRRSDHDEASLGVEVAFRRGGGGGGWSDEDAGMPGTAEVDRAGTGSAAEDPGASRSFDGSGTARQKVSFALYQHRLDQTSPAVPPEVPPSVTDSTYTRARLGWSAPLVRRGGVRLAGGVGVESERGDNRSVLVLPPFLGGEVAGDYEVDRTSAGAYAELTVDRGGRGERVFEVGSRLDAPEGGGLQWSPRLGVSLRPGGGATRFHASAGRAFKLPSFFALASPPALGGNPELRPESVVGADAGVERRFESARLEAGATLFYNRFEDLIDFDFETFRHVNRADVEARGAELTLGWTPAPRLTLAADATWQEVDDLTSEAPLRHRPRWVGGLRLAWRPRPGVLVALDGRATARSFDRQIPVPDRDTVPGYGLAGLTASWRPAGGGASAGRWRLDARVDNLADRDYDTLIGFPGSGRSVRVGVSYSVR